MQSGDESALNELIRKYQEPLFRFIWRYAGAELLGVSAKTVETRVYRARKRLENMLA
ncbi:MAG TPA: sigma factor-like helix-turn-helix DNA-binding protein [Terrimicrobiaceae bacterium]